MNSSKPEYYRHRFPAEIISRCVWLYFRFSLSYRDVEEMMAERGVAVSYETIRDWTRKSVVCTQNVSNQKQRDRVTAGI